MTNDKCTIHILFPRYFPGSRLDYSHYYPIKKWEKEFKKEGITFKFFKHHLNEETLLNCDILFVDWRYYDFIVKGDYAPKGFSDNGYHFLEDMLNHASNRGIKKILYDSVDAAGTRSYEIISKFDSVLKKQKLNNWYTKNGTVHRTQVWLPDEVEELPRFSHRNLTPEDINKIKVGWNIGMSDFRYFPNWFYKLRYSSTNIFPQSYKKLQSSPVSRKSRLLFSYRGRLIEGNERHSYNRKIMLDELKNAEDQLNSFEYVLGGVVSKSEYLVEQQNSKIGLSPFGYGEICYRDFEVMLNGSLLVKPSVEHLETWPDFYLEDETYIATKWDFSDLLPKLIEIDKNWEDYKIIASRAQGLLLHFQQSASEFINHFKNQLNL